MRSVKKLVQYLRHHSQTYRTTVEKYLRGRVSSAPSLPPPLRLPVPSVCLSKSFPPRASAYYPADLPFYYLCPRPAILPSSTSPACPPSRSPSAALALPRALYLYEP